MATRSTSSPPTATLAVRTYGAAHGSHAHDHFQVLLGLEGTLELEVQGRGQRVRPGEGLVVPPGERHDFEARGGARCLVLDTGDDGWARVAGLPPGGAAASLAPYLAQALAAGLPQARALGPALLLEAWLPPTAEAPPRVRRAIDWDALARWACREASAPPTLAELAARVHLSPAQLVARCRAERGLSPQAWLRAQRLVAARALRAQGWPVARVAAAVGYRSPSALTAALRRDLPPG